MYISKIKIVNYKGFKDTEIVFRDGLNVILGQNNGGKSTILDAISLVIDTDKSKRLSAWDFHQGVDIDSIKETPPAVSIQLFFSMSNDEGEESSDVALFSSYAVALLPKLESCLSYEFYLPNSELQSYRDAVRAANSITDVIKILESNFIRKYTYAIYGGKISLHQTVASEDIKKIDFQKVDALRNVENDLFSKKAELLHSVLAYFLDYDIKKGKNSQEDKDQLIKVRREKFQQDANTNIKSLTDRIEDGKNAILKYADDIGALYRDNDLNFDGGITEEELIRVLNIIVSSTIGYSVPISNNGLGYNNLIYISLLLAKMQSNKEVSYMGQTNAKAFSVLCIEEPEAHLHPELQYHFLKFLRQNIAEGKVRQVFITSHSPSLTAKVKLDELCCLSSNNTHDIKAFYPGAIYKSDETSKKYVQRYLDATRADIFFAGKILFVEGIAEQILIPVFVRILGYEHEWLKSQAVIINLSGRYFDHFLKMYDGEEGSFTMRVACLTDRDPEHKRVSDDKFKACWPIEYEADTENFQYRNHGDTYVEKYSSHHNVRFFCQNKYGKTLEYEIARCNYDNPVIITDSISNKTELKEMINAKSFPEVCSACKSDNLVSLFQSATTFNDCEKRKGLIAARYLNSLSKGEYALDLATTLSELDESEYKKFIVPTYITNAIKWLLEK